FKKTIDADAQTLNDAAASTHASLAPGSVNTGYDSVDANIDIGFEKLRFRAGYRLRNNLETGGGAASALDPVGKARTDRYNADLSLNDLDL
ncbi:hypothetical protein LAN29_23155, partial [Mycobacterium tuberculosis]|nr:hypothetical protein [Mycobacterium tuberculosis]